MFNRTPRIIARPPTEQFQSWPAYLQEKILAQTKAQDFVREYCGQMQRTQQPGHGFQKPAQLAEGDRVLVRRDIVATNTINSNLKLMRIYSPQPATVVEVDGNHITLDIGRAGRNVYHRSRLRKFEV